MSYIHSKANRSYVAAETSYGQQAPIAASNRFAAFRVHAEQRTQPVQRRDKTGSRSYLGGASLRTNTQFEVETYLVSWAGTIAPAYGTLFSAACGASSSLCQGLSILTASGVQVQTTEAHNLAVGSGVSFQGEIRFVTSVVDALTFNINAQFPINPPAGALLSPTLTYRLASLPPSISLYDYWDPVTAVSRAVTGAVVDNMTVRLDGPYHEFTFSGPAAYLQDSTSVDVGQSNASLPVEPPVSQLSYSVVPGNLGEVWIGNPANSFATLTQGSVMLRNNVSLRDRETGSTLPQAASFGEREILARFSLLATDDAQSVELYSAARQRTALPVMLQMGKQQGRALALYMPSVIPSVPLYDDDGPRLVWEFDQNVAQGTADNELVVAFA